jgi:SAM-dependent methyltransferase
MPIFIVSLPFAGAAPPTSLRFYQERASTSRNSRVQEETCGHGGKDGEMAGPENREAVTSAAADACRVCGNAAGNRARVVRERMFGFGTEFRYVECGACGCLQIDEVPPDLDRYYPDEYHSLQPGEAAADPLPLAFLKRQRARYCLGGFNPLGFLVRRAFGEPEYYPWLRRMGVRLDHEILDVGAGTGRLLLAVRREGFTHLTGIEPYIPQDLDYGNGVRILKCELSALEGPYDTILLHHVFEHMPDPAGTFRELRRLIRPGRFVFLRLPVVPCHAWRHYGADWVQWDAPRHLFLHSPASIRYLAGQAGFEVTEVEFDSTEFQFWGSEIYARGMSMEQFDLSHFKPEEIAAWSRQAEELNRRGEGDQACFYLRRT